MASIAKDIDPKEFYDAIVHFDESDEAQDLYYKVMKPVVVKKVDINKDEEYKRIVGKTIETEPNEDEFGYYDWYSYMKNNTINTRGFLEPLRLKKF